LNAEEIAMPELRAAASPEHAAFLFLHLLLLVTWLGVDLGMFAASFFLRNPRYPIGERLMLARLAAILDMGPRASLLLVYPSGAWLAWAGGWGFRDAVGPLAPTAQLALVTLPFLAWEALVWVQFAGHRRVLAGAAGPSWERFLPAYRRWDLRARFVLAALLLIDGALGLAGRGMIAHAWLAWKVLFFGLVVVLGIAIRLTADAWPALIREIVDRGSTPAREAALRRAMRRATPFVIALYALLLAISLAGIVK
jgi:hypothetical protein